MNNIVDRTIFSSLPLSDKIQYIYETSPVFFPLFILSALLMIYIGMKKVFLKRNYSFKMVSIRVNQLVLSTILMISSISGWVAERKFSGKAGVMLFVFSFIFLSIVSLMFRSNDRRIDR